MTETTPRRPGSETREEILRVALDLFTRQGFEGTSIRDLSQALGVTKSALYYHFPSKEAIIRTLVDDRRAEVADLLAWVEEQPPGPDLLRRTALRWVESTTPRRLSGMRFARANSPTMRRLAAEADGVSSWVDDVVVRVLPAGASTQERLMARMAFDTVAAALFAAQAEDADDDDVLQAARAATEALTA
ncbi:MAG: helix-turn-helix domain containing protein [Quadrisphaera sp.]